MIERPLLLRGPQVRAFREGRQTQGRRPMNPQPFYDPEAYKKYLSMKSRDKGAWVWQPRKDTSWLYWDNWGGFDPRINLDCSFGREGDRLWIRETWQAFSPTDREWSSHKPAERAAYKPDDWRVIYRADNPDVPEWMGWNPSIHMPRWASRLTLEIERVRVERVQDISEDDACRETGALLVYPGPGPEPYHRNMIQVFAMLWDSIYAKTYPWSSNPWVWVTDLKVVDATPKS